MSGNPREEIGRLVREVWDSAVRELIPDPKPSWLTPWEDLDDFQREVDMRIGAAVAEAVRAEIVALLQRASDGKAEYAGPAEMARETPFEPGQIMALTSKALLGAAALVADPSLILLMIPAWTWTAEEHASVLATDRDDAAEAVPPAAN